MTDAVSLSLVDSVRISSGWDVSMGLSTATPAVPPPPTNLIVVLGSASSSTVSERPIMKSEVSAIKDCCVGISSLDDMDDEGSRTGARSTRSSGSADEGATFAEEGDGDMDGGGERGKADPTPSDISRLRAG